MYKYLIFVASLFIFACTQKEETDTGAMTPWGTSVHANNDTVEQYSLEEILQSGELRALTLTGDDTYFTFNKAEIGVHYLLGVMLVQELGVRLNVEVCRDTLEMVRKLKDGEGDIIIMPVNKAVSTSDSLIFCGPEVEGHQWVVMGYSKELAKAVNAWYQPEMLAEAQRKQDYVINSSSVQCQVYAPVLDRSKGLISEYDHLFKAYSMEASTDWRLLAAISYQESCFDPKARSWAGACGLMQIMPATAETYGLNVEEIFDPEANVSTAAKIINQLTMLYRDVPDPAERMNFVLASYNAGPGHVRDAMALTKKYGGDEFVWDEVAEYILLLSQPKYYCDAVVKSGYMRGTETHDYVYKVRDRYQEYTGFALGDDSFGVTETGGYAGVSTQPTRRTVKQNKYQI